MSEDATKTETEVIRENRPISAYAVHPVPRVVHQVWVQGEAEGEPAVLMAKVAKESAARGWAYRLWHAHEGMLRYSGLDPGDAMPLVAGEWPNLWWSHLGRKCCNVAAKANLIRWLVLNAFGGLYLDADVDLFRLPSDLSGAWVMGTGAGRANNAVQAQPAGHPYCGRILDRIRADPRACLGVPIQGPPLVTACLGSDVNLFAYEDWNGPRAKYGNHLNRGNPWHSQTLKG